MENRMKTLRGARTFRRPVSIGDGSCSIELTRGHITFIDEADAPALAACNWQVVFGNSPNLPYAKGCMDGKSWIRMHRFLMQAPKHLVVDHIDGNTLNNRRANLRLATREENDKNRQLQKNNKTGFKGVTIGNRAFVASIAINKRAVYLGTFRTAIEAALSYDAAAVAHFGEFACTNASLGLLTT
jgi:hypothetical protein